MLSGVVNLHPAAVIVALLVLGSIWGLLGHLLRHSAGFTRACGAECLATDRIAPGRHVDLTRELRGTLPANYPPSPPRLSSVPGFLMLSMRNTSEGRSCRVSLGGP